LSTPARPGRCRGGSPGADQAIVALKRGDVLLVAKRDRLGRDVYEVLGIQRLIARRGARVVSAAGEGTDADSPSDVLMRGLIDQSPSMSAT
jgi:DNA invertase Pin-like site-specific DNA recombinase